MGSETLHRTLTLAFTFGWGSRDVADVIRMYDMMPYIRLSREETVFFQLRHLKAGYSLFQRRHSCKSVAVAGGSGFSVDCDALFAETSLLDEGVAMIGRFRCRLHLRLDCVGSGNTCHLFQPPAKGGAQTAKLIVTPRHQARQEPACVPDNTRGTRARGRGQPASREGRRASR